MSRLGRGEPKRPFISWGLGLDSSVVSPPLIDQAGILFEPALAQQITVGLIDQSGILFSPQVNRGVSVGLIDQSGVLFGPRIDQKLFPGLIDQSGALFSPIVIGSQTVLAALIDQSGVVFSPEIQVPAAAILVDTSKWDRRGGDVIRSWHGIPRTEPRFY